VDGRHRLPDEAERLIRLFVNFAALPAGRHLWASGVASREFVFNCHAAGWDDLTSHFGFMLDQLMQGGGVGSNYSNRYLERLAPITSAPNLLLFCARDHRDWNDLEPLLAVERIYAPPIMVHDSREGWRDALTTLIDAHQDPRCRTVAFDLSALRHNGSPIARSGGTAAGPAALAQLLKHVSDQLSQLVGRRLSTSAAMNIDHAIARTAAAGGTRRAARMAVKSWRDTDVMAFIDAKAMPGDHWTTNLSVEIDDEFVEAARKAEPRALAVLDEVVAGMLRNGEPGLWNASLSNAGERGAVVAPNPCGEVALEAWESCTIGHVNLSYFDDDVAAMADAHRLMARFLIRSTFTTVDDPSRRTVLQRNRRIGVGHFGYHGWVVGQGVRYSESHRDASIQTLLRRLHAVTREAADAYADELGIARPVKVTTVAPTGTVAKLAGASEGIQPIFSRHYLRRIRLAAGSQEAADLREQGYGIEPDEAASNTVVVTIPTRDLLVEHARTRWGAQGDRLVESADEIELKDFLSVQRMYQECYADNAVSATGHIPQRSYARSELAALLLDVADTLKGTTVLVDGRWRQAPYERISELEYLAHAARTASAAEACLDGCCIAPPRELISVGGS
jgi:ribonucleoside-triphosphate reductase